MRRWPAEWEPHAGCWLAWPSHPGRWRQDLAPVRAEFTALCHAIASPPERPQEPLRILAPGCELREQAKAALGGLPWQAIELPCGDLWLRDTGPVFTWNQTSLEASCFGFNGWGEKYLYPDDPELAVRIAERCRLPRREFSWVLEGGAVDGDGQGTCLTTRSCLLNPNRHPATVEPSEGLWERRLEHALGVRRIIWLTGPLQNDHTDGHVDTLARFLAPGRVVCMEPTGRDDPNRQVLQSVLRELAQARDAEGDRLELVRLPSPGRVVGDHGEPLPASYLNFYISNGSVVVPSYGAAEDGTAIGVLTDCFPDRHVLGLPAHHLLQEGGTFHCITQPEPAVSSPGQQSREARA